jgi:hypothetical protein
MMQVAGRASLVMVLVVNGAKPQVTFVSERWSCGSGRIEDE